MKCSANTAAVRQAGRVTTCPSPSILVSVNTPERNDNCPWQIILHETSLGENGTKEEIMGHQRQHPMVSARREPNWESKLGKSRRKKL